MRGCGVLLMVLLHSALYHYGGLERVDLSNPPLVVTLIGFLLMWGGLFAVLSGASHAIRAIERFDQGIPVGIVRRWELFSGAGFIILGIAYFMLFGPSLIDLAIGSRENSVLVELIREGRISAPSPARSLYMNTLFMVGFSTLLVAPLFAWLAQHNDPRSVRFSICIAIAAFIALSSSWLRVPLYPMYEQALAEGRYGFLMLTFWLVNKSEPMWPSLGLALSGSLLGLIIMSPSRAGRMQLPTCLGILLVFAGVTGWVLGPDTMLRRSIDWTWYAITLTQAGVMLLVVLWVHRQLDTARKTDGRENPMTRILIRFSRVSLSVLFGETVLAEAAGRGLGIIAPGWNQSLGAAVLFGVANVGVWMAILVLWEKSNYRGSVESAWVWVMSMLGRPSTKLAEVRR
jgi:hypothetical protein